MPASLPARLFSRRLWRGVLGVALMVLLGLAGVQAWKIVHEPRFQERRVSQWLRQLDDTKNNPLVAAGAWERLQAAGPAAEPVLRAALQVNESLPRRAYREFWAWCYRKWPAVRARLPRPAPPQSNLRNHAIFVIGQIKPPLTNLVEDLTAFLSPAFLARNPDTGLLSCDMALHTLAMMGPAAGSALPAVIQLAQASPMQASACLVLGDIGGTNAEVLTAFQSILPNLSPDACRNAMMVLGQFASQSVHLELLLPMLLNALQSPRAEVSDLAYTALFPLGEARLPPSYKSVQQTVAPLVSHPDVRVRMVLARFLGRFTQNTSETEAVLPGLLVLARDTNSVPKLTALRALRRAGIQTDPVWQAAEDAAVKEADQEIIQVVAEILLKPEAPKERAVPLFEKLLAWQETSLDNRVLAAEGLWRAAGKTNIYIETLGERVANGEDGGRWSALEKLGRFAKEHSGARRQIERGLKSPNPRIRGKAAIILGQLGPAAFDSVPVLTKALEDQYKNVQDAAREALEKIKTPPSPQTSQ